MAEAKDLLDRWWRAIEDRDIDGAAELFSAECDFVLPGSRFRGPEGLKPFLQNYLTAFPDLRVDVIDGVASDQAVAAEFRSSGTQTGPLGTPRGSLPATGTKVAFQSCVYAKVHDGKFTTWHTYFDHPAWVGPSLRELTKRVGTLVATAVRSRAARR